MKLKQVNYETMEKKSFECATFLEEWKGWDELDIMACTYYNAKLSIDLGPYKKGDTLPWVSVDLQRCFVEIPEPNDDSKTITFEILFEEVTVELT